MTMIVMNKAGAVPNRGKDLFAAIPQLGNPAMLLTPTRNRRLDAYADRFADLFNRADQSRCFRLYLRGLLAGGPRKNVEAIAARIGDGATGGSGLAQSLQHFVSQSPWDAGRVFARYRELLPPVLREQPGVWVVHDGVIPKKGRHSVGTQRQLARSLGRKVNCQVAVVVGRAGAAGYVPLAVRLYLPGIWLREYGATVEKTVPAEFRTHSSKPTIATGLLGDLTREGWAADEVAAEEGYRNGDAFRDSGITGGPLLTVAAAQFDWLKDTLGLDHFEGRTWTGWHHHAALVLAAYGFLLTEAALV